MSNYQDVYVRICANCERAIASERLEDIRWRAQDEGWVQGFDSDGTLQAACESCATTLHHPRPLVIDPRPHPLKIPLERREVAKVLTIIITVGLSFTAGMATGALSGPWFWVNFSATAVYWLSAWLWFSRQLRILKERAVTQAINPPPEHVNCRSALVPVERGLEFENFRETNW